MSAAAKRPRQAISAIDLAQRAVELAEEAGRAGTFAVGGLLVHRQTGKIIREARNQVIVDGAVDDPTAHVERQLADWWVHAHAAGEAPPAQQLLLVSSLEPCMMCAGALLQTGIACVAVEKDAVAGVGATGDFASLPASLRPQAAHLFSLFAGGSNPGRGPDAHPIPSPIVDRAATAFAASLGETQQLIADTGVLRLSRARAVLRPAQDCAHSETPAASLVHHKSGETLLSKGSGADGAAPGATPVLALIRLYAQLRRQHPSVLPAARNLRLVVHGRQDALNANHVCAFGAAGSFLEGPVAPAGRPFIHFPDADEAFVRGAEDLLAAFPPLYSEIIRLRASS